LGRQQGTEIMWVFLAFGHYSYLLEKMGRKWPFCMKILERKSTSICIQLGGLEFWFILNYLDWTWTDPGLNPEHLFPHPLNKTPI
jgi:hypothetical protein